MSLRSLQISALAVCIAVAVAEIALPCPLWRYPVGALMMGFSLFAIAVVGTTDSRPDISDAAHNATIYLAASGLVAATFAVFGVLC